MTVERKDKTQLILCECGCGQTLLKYRLEGKKVRWSRPRKFIWGHQNRPQEIKDKISRANRGEKNGMYSGDKVGYLGLHYWIRKYLPKPKDNLCQFCHQKPLKEAACITGIYNRDFSNWAWFCRPCHCKWDNIGIRNKIRHKSS